MKNNWLIFQTHLQWFEQFNTAFTQDRPVRAYVLEQDVTNAQQVNTMIEQNSTL